MNTFPRRYFPKHDYLNNEKLTRKSKTDWNDRSSDRSISSTSGTASPICTTDAAKHSEFKVRFCSFLIIFVKHYMITITFVPLHWLKRRLSVYSSFPPFWQRWNSKDHCYHLRKHHISLFFLQSNRINAEKKNMCERDVNIDSLQSYSREINLAWWWWSFSKKNFHL